MPRPIAYRLPAKRQLMAINKMKSILNNIDFNKINHTMNKT